MGQQNNLASTAVSSNCSEQNGCSRQSGDKNSENSTSSNEDKHDV
jgi:hypothetical protein